MKTVIYLNASRDGYSPNQIDSTMTVYELISYLEGFDEDAPVYLSHDNGYTYGGITEGCFSEDEIADEEE